MRVRELSQRLLGCFFTAALVAAPVGAAAATGRILDVEVIDRTDHGQILPVHEKDGQRWIVGTPGHEYWLRVRSREYGRLLVVPSVDGVNVLSGQTAAPDQRGYVIDGLGGLITGWRKNLATTAAFYFTDLGDSYASRTGRPENVGVIGFAVFRERRPVVDAAPPPPVSPPAPPRTRSGAPEVRSQSGTRDSAKPAQRGEAAAAAPVISSVIPAPAPPGATLAPSLGTGHGREESSYTYVVPFDRATAQPVEVITIRYDRRENLVAMGILPGTAVAGEPRAFPEWNRGFVPDPPPR